METLNAVQQLVAELDAQSEATKQALNAADNKNTHFEELTALRQEGRRYFSEVDEEVKSTGRIRLMGIVSTIYATHHDWNNRMPDDTRLLTKCKVALTREGHKIKSNTTQALILTRYCLPGFTDKQISVFAASLTQALKNKIEPANFVQFVRDNKGFDGVRKLGMKARVNATANGEHFIVDGKTEILKFSPIDSITDIVWKENEDYRIVVLTRNEDDSADVRDPSFDPVDAKLMLNKVRSLETERAIIEAKLQAEILKQAKRKMEASLKKAAA